MYSKYENDFFIKLKIFKNTINNLSKNIKNINQAKNNFEYTTQHLFDLENKLVDLI